MSKTFKQFLQEDHSDYAPIESNYYGKLIAEYIWDYRQAELDTVVAENRTRMSLLDASRLVAGDLKTELEAASKKLAEAEKVIKMVKTYSHDHDCEITPSSNKCTCVAHAALKYKYSHKRKKCGK